MTRSPSLVQSPVLRWLLPINLGVQILIVVTGGLVRLTGSGLGCSQWPACEPGSYTPTFRPEDGIHPYVEFGNRMVGLVVGLVALAILYAVWRGVQGRARGTMLGLAGAVLGGTVGQGVLGGISVITELNPVMVLSHFVISMVLISLSTVLLLTHRRTERGQPTAMSMPLPMPRLVRVLAVVTAGVGGIAIVLGTIVTGSGPHSGDADQPARLGFDPRAVAWLHADSVMLFVGLVVAMVVGTSLLPRHRSSRRPWRLVLTISLVQGIVGHVQYATGVPVPLVSLHMLGASLLVATMTWGVLSVVDGTRPEPAPAEAHDHGPLQQGKVEQRIDGDTQKDQGEVADRVVEQPHRT